jgi:hypothetical protein
MGREFDFSHGQLNSSTKPLIFVWLAVRDDFGNWLVQNAA